jgi:hypothetical protein
LQQRAKIAGPPPSPYAVSSQNFVGSAAVLPCARVSAADEREPEPTRTQAPPRPPAAARGGTPKRSIGLVVVLVWLLGTLALGARVVEAGGLSVDGEHQGLLPERHRDPTGEPWLLLRSDETEGPADTADGLGQEPGEAARSNLLAAALAIAQAMPEDRVALAPPANAVTAWLDAHGLYLLPIERHRELAERLDEKTISAAIQGLTARLSSPLFGVSGEEARRDPLGLAPILARESGRLGHVQSDDASAPSVTGSGDLLSADGHALVIQLRSERPLETLLEEARLAVTDLPITVTILGPEAHREVLRAQVDADWPRLLSTLAAALTLVLALALRRIRPVLCLIACLVSGVLLLETITGALTPLSLPFAALLPAFACGGALRLQQISGRGWAGGALVATALVPLWFSPYPEWESWSVHWLVGAAALIVTVRVVMPVLLRLVRGDVQWRSPGFMLAPMPALGLLLLAGATGAGAWASPGLRYAGADTLRASDEEYAEARRVLREQFFDPAQLVEAHTTGSTPAQALERAAVEAEALAKLVGPEAERLDSPGSYVIPTPELEQRMQSLSSFELPKRMQRLHDVLEAQGLRAEAFTEFLHGAADIEAVPTAQAALDDALGTWMERYVIEDPEADESARWRVRSVLQLEPKTTAPDPTAADGAPIELRGPTIAARHDATLFRDRVGIYVAIGLWVGAFLVWLGTGSLAVAISAAVAGLATQSGVLFLLSLLRQPVGPQLLPALLLIGVAGIVAAGRACRAIDLGRPLVAGGMLTAGICQIAAGIALLVSGEPLWRQMGLVVASGCALAVGLGLFAAPGMCLLLRRVGGVRSDSERGDPEGDDE